MPKFCDALMVVEEPFVDVQVIGARITNPATKKVYPNETFTFEVTVKNIGTTTGNCTVNLTSNGEEISGSPIVIPNVAPGDTKSEAVDLTAPLAVGVYNICAEEVR